MSQKKVLQLPDQPSLTDEAPDSGTNTLEGVAFDSELKYSSNQDAVRSSKQTTANEQDGAGPIQASQRLLLSSTSGKESDNFNSTPKSSYKGKMVRVDNHVRKVIQITKTTKTLALIKPGSNVYRPGCLPSCIPTC